VKFFKINQSAHFGWMIFPEQKREEKSRDEKISPSSDKKTRPY